MRSRADIVYIKDGKLFVGEVKTGKNAKLSEQQKILKEAYKKEMQSPQKANLRNLLKRTKSS
ncbi:hypothetical protein CEV08_08435 [Bartonella tribocorum]|uniref:Uncharacterized protein n=1 Tax=Bartonella tribocorum TaxID=85701 RepID=A0A2N9Y948_9HYPH|nr:hypothetical protein CEV08_08435 [Bartonella tribocorum]